MDYKIIFCFILLTFMAAAYHDGDDDYSNYEDEYENTLSDEEFTKKEEAVTTRPVSYYEVTEIVIDIPDNRTRGPIIANYSIARPLNLAPTTTTTLATFEKENSTIENNNNNKVTTNKNDNDVKITVDPYNNIPFVPIIKEYWLGIKKGIVDGFNSIINVNEKSNTNNGDNFHSYPGPFSFISKLQKQSTDAAHKFHSTLFGQKFDDVF
ncbi:uncharacterized protein LOC126775677 [Nymphalis io]|uniref:uncharacterized protein LOC126775677 n=1 Tax=Inachis io TaxID=171585 RepID=UPI002169D07C|nr:uncharacterized protein LOC126775677 [Nymphalis io]